VLSKAKAIRAFIVVIVCTIAGVAAGQSDSFRVVRLAMSDTIVVDSLSLFPGRTRVILSSGDTLDASLYEVLAAEGRIVFLNASPSDTVMVVYQTLPFRIPSTYQHKSREQFFSSDGKAPPRYAISRPRGQGIYDDQGITKSGSISRGIAFGNAQNLSVNSSLNLQMSGRITERYSLLASVTDDNIPIQPEGTSQQLQDFDQVFIQVFDDRSKLIAGDFILRKPKGYFMNYFKRAQGGYVQGAMPIHEEFPEKGTLTVEASASVSKGRFARNVIQGVEGNQGPYRLTGDNNELFIVILAGTEAVYIDGRLMERGQDKDYIIDYNAAELTFTPRQFITKDRRITVEFQYSDKRFARPLLTTAVEYTRPGSSYHLNFFSENDARNQPLQQTLTQGDRRILAGAGDDPLLAVTSGIDSVGFSASNVLYAIRDSLGFDSVFIYSTNPEIAVYRVTFTFVGNGNGDYIEDGFTSNGRKFRWVAPEWVDGTWVRRGGYAPVIRLFAPQKRQLLSAGAEWKWGTKKNQQSVLSTEGALSVNDNNTFSRLDSGDDHGAAVKTVYSWKRSSVVRDSIHKARPGIAFSTGYEYTGRDFARIERFREVEFERNWNVLLLNLRNDQHIASGSGRVDFPGAGTIGAGAELFSIGNSYSGRRGNAYSRIRTKGGTQANVNASWLESSGQINSTFIRHKSDLSQRVGALRVGFRDEHELNRFYVGEGSRLLSPLSYRFYDWEVSLGNADTTKVQVSAFYRDRWDERPSPELSRASRADHYGVVFGLTGTSGNRFRAQVSNRRLRVIDPELFTQSPENTLLMRGEYSFRWWKGLVQGSTFYEVGSGLEQRREFIYLEVPAGQGNFVWIDYNGDGVRDLNEFEVAQFAYEANFIRSFVQTNEYVRTFTNQFSQSVWLTPAQYWKKPTDRFRKSLNRFSNQSSFRADRKTQREESGERLNPFVTDIADSSLLSLNASFRNVVFFNKSNPTFGADYTLQDVSGKVLLSSGFESRSDQFHQFSVRWNFYGDLTLLGEWRSGRKLVASDVLAGRNYSIDQVFLRPRINWQPSISQRLGVFGEYSEKHNTQGMGAESAAIRKGGVEWTVNSPEKGIAQANIQVVSISYTGLPNSSLAFDMLEGLVPGVNLTWGAGVQRTIANNLQLNLQYNARKPSGLATIHSGGVQVRAFF